MSPERIIQKGLLRKNPMEVAGLLPDQTASYLQGKGEASSSNWSKETLYQKLVNII